MDARRDRWHAATPRRNESAVLDSVVALRFRPIAPKPVAEGDFPGVPSPPETATGNRAKRKYVRVRKDGGNLRRRGRRRERKRSDGDAVVAMIPPVAGGKSDGGDSPENRSRTDRSVMSPGRAVVAESWVTVEHVTDTCMGGGELGLGYCCTDEERLRRLEGDTCPGFVSDASLRRVEWVNEAYRRMVSAAEVVVRLETVVGSDGTWGCRDGVASFTCRVRVEYHVRKEDNEGGSSSSNKKEKFWKVMPCDVWRLDSGGFAWRLDLSAALSLGL